MMSIALRLLAAFLAISLWTQGAAFGGASLPLPSAKSLAPFPQAMPPIPSGVIATRHLQPVRRCLDAGSCTVVFTGDSRSTLNQNNAIAPSENLANMFEAQFRSDNWQALQAGASVNFVNRGVGGQTWGSFSSTIGGAANSSADATQSAGTTTIPVTVPTNVTPVVGWGIYATGITNSSVTNPAAIAAITPSSVTITGTYTVTSGTKITFFPPNTPLWMSAPDQPWISTYIAPLAPDLIVAELGTNDQCFIAGSTIRTATSQFKNTSLFPKTPAVILVTNEGRFVQSPGDVSCQLNASSLVRSFAQSSGNGLSLTGSGVIDFGLIDVGRVDSMVRLGYDPVNQYMVQDASVTGQTYSSYPITLPSAQCDFDVQYRWPNGSSTLTGGAGFSMYVGSTVGGGSQRPRVRFSLLTGFVTAEYYAPGAGSITIPSLSAGTGDLYLEFLMKQGRLTVIKRALLSGSYEPGTVMFDQLVTTSGGPCTPELAVTTGSSAASVQIMSYSVGVPLGTVRSATDPRVWGAVGGSTGGNAINHLSAFGTANILRMALSQTRLSAHDGSLIQNYAAATGSITVSADLTTFSGLSGAATATLPVQIIQDRDFTIVNNDGTNTVNVAMPAGWTLNGSAAIAAGTNGKFKPVPAISTYVRVNWLLQRDLKPSANDNTPAFMPKAA